MASPQVSALMGNGRGRDQRNMPLAQAAGLVARGWLPDKVSQPPEGRPKEHGYGCACLRQLSHPCVTSFCDAMPLVRELVVVKNGSEQFPN